MASKNKIESMGDLHNLTPAEINERWSEVCDMSNNPSPQTFTPDPELEKFAKRYGYTVIGPAPKKQTFSDELNSMTTGQINAHWDEIRHRAMTENMDNKRKR